MNNQEQLLYHRGVSSEYFNYSGERVVVPYETRLNFLRAMHYDLDSASQLKEAIVELDGEPWKYWAPKLAIADQGKIELRFHARELDNPFDFNIATECGQDYKGTFKPCELEEIGEYYIDEVRYTARLLKLSIDRIGYHQFRLSSTQKTLNSKLVIAPKQCYQGNGLEQRKKVLGISCQLYTIRSKQNWGIGDFADLRELIELSASHGTDIIGLNPLHSSNLKGSTFISPYSPSDRRFLNTLYIAPNLVPEFADSPVLQDYHASDECQTELEALRSLALIDYSRVAALKSKIFAFLFAEFVENHLLLASPRASEFEQFVQSGAEQLATFCAYEITKPALDTNSNELNRKTSTALEQYRSYESDPRYHQYLQWLAHEQLASCQSLAIERGMHVGLMGDLAVGSVKGGAEVVGNPTLFTVNATIGAPPDQFTDAGQNWDLPVIDPVALKREGYQHFISLMQANMANYGALRIDHVMSMMRLWWWLAESNEGAYVYYPLKQLLAILRLESHRNKCLVIGEDMGVVPHEFREQMASSMIYSSKVFFFETHHDGRFIEPQDYKHDALLMITNHDVPTLAGWWNGVDIRLREQFNLIDPAKGSSSALAHRKNQKHQLLDWLSELGLLPESWQPDHLNQAAELKPLDMDLCAAIFSANARANSKFVLYQLDDLQLITDPVNVPGTFKQYPNWQRKQLRDTAVIFADPQVTQTLSSMRKERKK